MPSDRNRQFIDFEKPIKDLLEEVQDLKQKAEKSKVDFSGVIQELQAKIIEKRKEITENLTSWQRVQLSRHPDRPYTLKYIEKMTDNFGELYGGRNVKSGRVRVGGSAKRYQY